MPAAMTHMAMVLGAAKLLYENYSQAALNSSSSRMRRRSGRRPRHIAAGALSGRGWTASWPRISAMPGHWEDRGERRPMMAGTDDFDLLISGQGGMALCRIRRRMISAAAQVITTRCHAGAAL